MWLTSEIKRFALDSIVPVDSKAVLLECVWFFFFFNSSQVHGTSLMTKTL